MAWHVFDKREKKRRVGASENHDMTVSDVSKAAVKKRGFPLPQILIALGIVLCLLPIAGTWLANHNSSQVVSTMTDEASALTDGELEEYWAQASSWNAYLAGDEADAVVSREELWDYVDQLSFSTTSAMAWIEIPRAGIEMPIYHGDGADVLASGSGHVSATSLPVGGISAACWLEGHSGLRSASMFDNIRLLEEGDVVGVHVLDEVLAWRVTGWEIVDLADVTAEDLQVTRDEDVLVLVTCTTAPDRFNQKGRTGVNDKRLLVYAVRCEYDPAEFEELAQEAASDPATYVNEYTAQAIIAAVILAVVAVAAIAARFRRKCRQT